MQPCEIASRTIVPTIRFYLIKELAEKYGLVQSKIAEVLGITQPAVSQYLRMKRGRRIMEVDKRIREEISKLAAEIGLGKKLSVEKEICRICRMIRENE